MSQWRDNCWLSCHNHCDLSVERYHCFLNKVQAIHGESRDLHLTILETCKASQYAWNSAPIDGTNIHHSLPAVGRHYRLPMDIELSPSPALNDTSRSQLFTYICDVSNNSTFVTHILKMFIEEHRSNYRLRHNASIKQQNFEVDNAVKGHVSI